MNFQVAIANLATAILFTRLLLGELTLLVIAWFVLIRFEKIAGYLRSFFDDPVAGKKGSMARICAFLAMISAIVLVREMIRFAFTNKDSVGMVGVMASALTTLLGTGVLGLLLRKKADGSSEAIEDEPEHTDQHVAIETTNKVEVKP